MTKNGDKTYSKTSFKESKHARAKGGVFSKKSKTEEDDVEYHYTFKSKGHPRNPDGSFKNGVDIGKDRYGSKD